MIIGAITTAGVGATDIQTANVNVRIVREDARDKANELATAARMAISRVVSISETVSSLPVLASANAGRAHAAVPIAIGTDEVVAEVQVAVGLA